MPPALPDPGTLGTATALVYGCASLVTAAAFAVDKRAARLEHRRIPERVLHGLELVGGWPGAFLGMALWKHKRRKLRYVAVTVAIAAGHLAAWLWLAGGFG